MNVALSKMNETIETIACAFNLSIARLITGRMLFSPAISTSLL
jgi:hypothetical protein